MGDGTYESDEDFFAGLGGTSPLANPNGEWEISSQYDEEEDDDADWSESIRQTFPVGSYSSGGGNKELNALSNNLAVQNQASFDELMRFSNTLPGDEGAEERARVENAQQMANYLGKSVTEVYGDYDKHAMEFWGKVDPISNGKAIKDAKDYAEINLEIALLRVEQSRKGTLNEAQQKRLDHLRDIQPPMDTQLRALPINMAKGLAEQWPMWRNAGIQGFYTGLGAGAVVGGTAAAVGLATPIPGDEFALPVVLGLQAFSVGTASGAMAYMQVLMEGYQIEELYKLNEQYDGALTDQQIRTIGGIVGGINGMIEGAQWFAIAGNVPGLNKMWSGISKKVLSNVIAKGIVKNAFVKIAAYAGSNLLEEIVEEVLQESVNMVAHQIASSIDQEAKPTMMQTQLYLKLAELGMGQVPFGVLPPGASIDYSPEGWLKTQKEVGERRIPPLSRDEILNRYKETVIQTALTAGVFSGVGSLTEVYNQSKVAQREINDRLFQILKDNPNGNMQDIMAEFKADPTIVKYSQTRPTRRAEKFLGLTLELRNSQIEYLDKAAEFNEERVMGDTAEQVIPDTDLDVSVSEEDARILYEKASEEAEINGEKPLPFDKFYANLQGSYTSERMKTIQAKAARNFDELGSTINQIMEIANQMPDSTKKQQLDNIVTDLLQHQERAKSMATTEYKVGDAVKDQQQNIANMDSKIASLRASAKVFRNDMKNRNRITKEIAKLRRSRAQSLYKIQDLNTLVSNQARMVELSQAHIEAQNQAIEKVRNIDEQLSSDEWLTYMAGEDIMEDLFPGWEDQQKSLMELTEEAAHVDYELGEQAFEEEFAYIITESNRLQAEIDELQTISTTQAIERIEILQTEMKRRWTEASRLAGRKGKVATGIKSRQRNYTNWLLHKLHRPIPAKTVTVEAREIIETMQRMISERSVSDAKVLEWEELMDKFRKNPYVVGKDQLLAIMAKPVNRWSVADLEFVVQSAEAVRYLGKRDALQKNMEMDIIVQEQIDNAQDLTGKKVLDRQLDMLKNPAGISNKRFREVALAAPSKLLTMERIIDTLDGVQLNQGPLFDFFINRRNEAWGAELNMKNTETESMIQYMKDNKIRHQELFKKLTVGDFVWTQEYAMGVYLALQSDHTKTRVVYGNGITTEIAEQFVDQLDPKMKGMADRIQQYYRRIFPEVKEAYAYMTNQELQFIGNYYPGLSKDSIYKADYNMFLEAVKYHGAMPRTGIEKAFTEARVENEAALRQAGAIRLDAYSTYLSMVEQHAHYITHAELSTLFNRVVHDADFKYAVEKNISKAWYKTVENYTKYVENPKYLRKDDGIEKISNFMLRNNSIAALGFRMAVAVKQLPSYVYYMAKAGPIHLLTSVARFMTNPYGMWKKYADLDPIFKHRSHEQMLLQERMKGSSKFTEAQKKVASAAMFITRMFDRAVVTIGYDAVTRNSMGRGKMSQADAIIEARNATSATQPSGDRALAADIYRRSDLLSWVTMFTQQTTKIANMATYDAYAQLKNGRYDQFLMNISAIMIGGVSIWMLKNGRLPEPEDWQEILGDIFIGTLPIYGKSITGATRGYYQFPNPAMQLPYTIVSALRAYDEGDPVDAANKTMRALSLFFPFPEVELEDIIEGVQEGDWITPFMGSKFSEGIRGGGRKSPDFDLGNFGGF